MKELIFSIADIFDSSTPTGCLTQYGGSAYRIPAYQRGYKWGADDDGAVSILLHDLWTAFKVSATQQRKEYYLQYITIKPDAQQGFLEVIDGQQRLTTLSILNAVLAVLLGTRNQSAGKLYYAIRGSFFAETIDDNVALAAFINQAWETLITAKPGANKQDIYYLHAAARKINEFLLAKAPQPATSIELRDFTSYLARHVKLIVNSVETHVPGETVFKNLNTNKVPLTETELIKALIITRIGRAGTQTERRSFKEVLEARLRLGRLWDEITHWVNAPAVSTFYFESATNGLGLHKFLTLVARQLGYRKPEQSGPALPLFNFYNLADLQKAFATIKDTYTRLADWYAHDETYQLLGFCRFAKNGSKEKYNGLSFLQKCLNSQTKSELRHLLLATKATLLPAAAKIETLRYGQDDDAWIHAVLLNLSVFAPGTPARFDFPAFVRQKWSLEHIFPQTPEGKGHFLDQAQRVALREMLNPAMLADQPELADLLDKDTRTDEQQRYLKALQAGPLNSIGNMCLLTSSDNASNGCLPFPEKRRNVLRLVQQGNFVPKHTFDVFSKMLPALLARDPATWATWTSTDIDAHRNHIIQQSSL